MSAIPLVSSVRKRCSRTAWHRRALCSIVLSSLLISGCAPAARTPSRTIDSGRNVLTRSDLSEVDSLETVHDVILRLRPWFLNPRPGAHAARGAPVIAVFVNGHPAGGAEALRGLAISRIEAVYLVPPSEADRVLGGGRGADAIINVILRR